jgi:hypothetical protein
MSEPSPTGKVREDYVNVDEADLGPKSSDETSKSSSGQGFASMPKEQVQDIASKGGKSRGEDRTAEKQERDGKELQQ